MRARKRRQRQRERQAAGPNADRADNLAQPSPQPVSPQSVASAPPPTSRPTDERARHAVRIEAPVMNGRLAPWWTITTRLDALAADGLIGRRQYEALAEFRADLDRVRSLPASPLARAGHGSPGGSGQDLIVATRLDAARRLRVIRDRLGPVTYGLLCAVADDRSWREIGRQLGVRDRTARSWATAAIAALVDSTGP